MSTRAPEHDYDEPPLSPEDERRRRMRDARYLDPS